MWFFCGNTGLFFRDMGFFFSHMALFCRHNLSPTSSTRFVVSDYCSVTWSEAIIIEGTRRRYNYTFICICIHIYIYIERERERERERYVACPQVSVLYGEVGGWGRAMTRVSHGTHSMSESWYTSIFLRAKHAFSPGSFHYAAVLFSQVHQSAHT